MIDAVVPADVSIRMEGDIPDAVDASATARIMMREKPVLFLGFKSLRGEAFEFFACPECGKPKESLGYGADGLVECYKCHREFPHEHWGRKGVRRSVAVCAACGEKVQLTGDSCSSGPSWFCESCGNLVVFQFGKSFLSPREILSFDWAGDIHKRSVRIGKSLRIAECRSKREDVVTRLLHIPATREDPSFMFGSPEERKTLLCMDAKNYLGYLFWSDTNGKPVLRQIFVLKERQREGIGSAMIRHWAENFAFPVTEKFGIESPNMKSLGVLIKLGYARRDGPKVELTRCYLVTGM